jgi:two-component system OmpR family sensor kinase
MRAKASHSLRARLLWFVLLAIFMVAVLQAITVYRGALQQADAMFDDHLQQVARAMRSGVPLGLPLESADVATDFDLYVQIWGQDGTQIFRSTHSALPPRAVLGFSDVQANGNRYRVYTLQTPSQTVQIAQDLSARSTRASALAAKALLPFALLTPLLMLAVWWVINRSLAPIARARSQLASRAADDFSPLANDDLPDEVRPLVDELNLLFDRVRSAFDAQKNFVADAAHELRSPLTALRLQAQTLARKGELSAAHDTDLARLNQGIDRAIRLVEQLLVLAREEAASDAPQFEALDLLELVRQTVADLLPQARLKQLDMGLEKHQTAWVQGQPEALLRNLLENAIKYTPTSGQIDISVEVVEGQAVLTVEDSGPGIAKEAQLRVFDRFFRASDALTETGSGLGLAIVKTIADRHGASFRLDRSERLGGLRVQMRMATAPVLDAAA